MQNQPISPAATLAQRLNTSPVLVLVTGGRGAGKTTWCLDLYHQALRQGIQPVGLISPAVFQSDLKTGFDLMNLATGERRRLAHLSDPSTSPPRLSETAIKWAFDSEVLAWGNHILAEIPASELLIIDELGPLEFVFHNGWTAGLACIDAKICHLSCVVIRPELLDTALTRWPWAQVIWVQAPIPETNQP